MQHYVLKVNDQGSIISLRLKSANKDIDFQQAFGHYTSELPSVSVVDSLALFITGSSSDGQSHQSSGLYVFRPVGSDPPRRTAMKQFSCLKVNHHPSHSSYLRRCIHSAKATRKLFKCTPTMLVNRFGCSMVHRTSNSIGLSDDWIRSRRHAADRFVAMHTAFFSLAWNSSRRIRVKTFRTREFSTRIQVDDR